MIDYEIKTHIAWPFRSNSYRCTAFSSTPHILSFNASADQSSVIFAYLLLRLVEGFFLKKVSVSLSYRTFVGSWINISELLHTATRVGQEHLLGL